MTLVYDRPEFSEDAKREIRWALNEVWQRDHQAKNSPVSPQVRDTLSARMRRFEEYMKLVGHL